MLIGSSYLNHCMASAGPPCCTRQVSVRLAPGLRLMFIGTACILAEMAFVGEGPKNNKIKIRDSLSTLHQARGYPVSIDYVY